MKKKLSMAMIFLILSGFSLAGLDLGGSFESSLLTSSAGGNSSLAPTQILRFWSNQAIGADFTLLIKASLSDSLSLGLPTPIFKSNRVTGALEYLVLFSENFWVGRTDFKDFSGSVLNTKLDGFQFLYASPELDIKAILGTSAGLFKSGSTIVISEDDVKDRLVDENWLLPSTLWASPRIVGGINSTFRQILPNQSLNISLLAQYDLRPGSPLNDTMADTKVANRVGAPISTAYLGLGGEGRIAGSLFWNAWGYLLGGTSLTASGAPLDFKTSQFLTWKSSYILAAMGSLDIALLLPELSHLVINLNLQMGSWDPDGASPDQNAPENPGSLVPTLFTGWVGISRTGGSLIFSPQPSNMFTSQLLISAKPHDSLQLVATFFTFLRPSPTGISEAGINPKSQERFLGMETDLSALWRPVSDFGASLGLGIFAPNPGVLVRSVEWKIQTGLSLSF